MDVACDGYEVVIRFTPITAEGLRKNAVGTYDEDVEDGRTPARYGVSVIAGWCDEGESIEQTIAKILETTTLIGRTIAVVTGTELRARGFELVPDPNAREPLHHLVGDDPFMEVPRVDVLASLLDGRRMSNPAYKKGQS